MIIVTVILPASARILGIIAFSYQRTIYFRFISDPDLFPDLFQNCTDQFQKIFVKFRLVA